MHDPQDDAEASRPDLPRGLYLSRRGNWFHDGDRIVHAGLTGLLHRSIARAPDGCLVVTTGLDVVAFASEDAPFRVYGVDVVEHRLRLRLSNEAVVDVEGPILIDGGGRMRCAVSGAKTSGYALFTRAAGQGLEPLMIEHDGGVAIDVDDGIVVPVVDCADRDWSAVPCLSA